MSKRSSRRYEERDYERYDEVDGEDARSEDDVKNYHSNRSLTRIQPQYQAPAYKRLIICCDGE